MDTWIGTMVRRAHRRRVIAWGILLAAAVLTAAAQQRYIYNFINGPFTLGADDLAQIHDVTTTPKYFVRVAGSKALDTGLERISVRKRNGVETSRSVSARYYALVMGDRLLLTKTSQGPLKTIEGYLEPIPFEVVTNLFNSVDVAALRPRFYPFFVNDESFRFNGYVQIAVALVFGFLFVRMAMPAWRYMKDVSSHPSVRRVNSWGDATGVAVAAEREFHSPRYKGGEWRVGDNYFVRSSIFSFDILRNSDLLWAYKRVTKHSVNFVPTGKSHNAVLICDGGTAEVAGSDQSTEALLAFVAQHAPWAFLGYSDELANAFKKSTDVFCAAVEQRKQDWRAGAGA